MTEHICSELYVRGRRVRPICNLFRTDCALSTKRRTCTFTVPRVHHARVVPIRCLPLWPARVARVRKLAYSPFIRYNPSSVLMGVGALTHPRFRDA
jgi:hypothetical protein